MNSTETDKALNPRFDRIEIKESVEEGLTKDGLTYPTQPEI